jgi:mannose-P-dolichol utilization defect protein 1
LATVSFAASSVTTTKFWIFREDCFDKFISLDISDVDCLKFTVSKGIGFAIVIFSCILKLPQINKIIANNSVDGLAPISLYAEFVNYLGFLGNSIRLRLSFSVYGEGVFINIQNFIIILLIWKFNRQVTIAEKIVFSVFCLLYSYILFDGSFMNE